MFDSKPFEENRGEEQYDSHTPKCECSKSERGTKLAEEDQHASENGHVIRDSQGKADSFLLKFLDIV